MSERFSNIKRIGKYVDPRDNKAKTVEIREAKVEPATGPEIREAKVEPATRPGIRIGKYVDPRDNKVKTIEIREAKVEPATRPPIDMTDFGWNFPEFRQRALDKAEFQALKEKEAQEQKWPLSSLTVDDIMNLPLPLQQKVQQEWKKQAKAGEYIPAHRAALEAAHRAAVEAARRAALEAIVREYRKTKKLPEVGEPLDVSELEFQR